MHDSTARRLLEGWSGRGLRSIERELAELRERRELLEEQLPTAEQVTEAERRASGLVKQAAEQSEGFAESWSAFMAALADAESAARQVAQTRSEAEATIRELVQVREQFGLGIEVPREPRPGQAEEKFAGLLGSLLRNVGYSQALGNGLEAELAGARRECKREAD